MATSTPLARKRIADNRLKDATKSRYGRKVTIFASWLGRRFPSFVGPQFEDQEFDMIAMTPEIFDDFFEHICQKLQKDGTYFSPTKYQSFEHVSGYNSALKYHFKKHKVPFRDDWNNAISDFLSGFERLVAGLKKDGVIPMTEGKMPLTFTGYMFFAEETWKHGGESQELNIFARTFLLLCWNLIARCISVAGLMFEHIGWKDDCLTIVFPTHKGDQEGRDAAPKHVFANPSHPEICPVLSLAIFVFTNGFRRSGSKTTVFGDENDAESRFGTWLRNMCDKNDGRLRELGLAVKDIGTHSFRKGVASFLSGMPGGPSPISIYLRAGWSLGAVQKRYIMDGQGEDQLCGRAASGLPLTSPLFSQLPPHFKHTLDEPLLSESEWENILPGYSSYYPKVFCPVLPYLLASLAFHHDFLDKTMPSNHPLRLQRVWTSGILTSLAGKVYCGVGRNPNTNMTATGIPPHIVVANQIDELQTQIVEQYHSLKTRLDELPCSLRTSLLENFAVQGVVPMTPSQMESILRQEFATYMGNNRNGHGEASTSCPQASASTFELTIDEFGKLWEWGDPARQHVVPQGFEFPTSNLKVVWDLWWGGDRSRRITYYRRISPGLDLPKGNGQYFSKAKFVINTLLETCSVSKTAVAAMSVSARDALFERGILALFQDILDPGTDSEILDTIRFGDISFCRLYDRLKLIQNAGKPRRRRRRPVQRGEV